MKYVGVCYDSGAWGGDLTGVLIRMEPEGPMVVSSHISSNEHWSEHDITEWHYPKRPEPTPDDEYEWLGRISPVEFGRRFLPRGEPEPADV